MRKMRLTAQEQRDLGLRVTPKRRPREMSTEEAKAADRASWSEKTFTTKVIDLAKGLGWLVAHFRPAMTGRMVNGKPKWVTAVQGDGKGFPDLILVRRSTLIAAELKVGRNKATAEQAKWLTAFSDVDGAECYVWKPEHWEEIGQVLNEGYSDPMFKAISRL